jgi:parvulin-like peptidyl-prolyl isomerase
MKPKLFLFELLILTLLFFYCAKPQQRVLAEVAGRKITAAEIYDKLPKAFSSDTVAEKYVRNLLEQLIVKRLFIKAATDLGLEKELAPAIEEDKKRMLISELYEEVVTKGAQLSSEEKKLAKKIADTEVRVKVFKVPDLKLAQELYTQYKNNSLPETLISRYQEYLSSQYLSDDFIPLGYIEAPLRNKILELKDQTLSEPISDENGYKLVYLLEKRKVKSINRNQLKRIYQILEHEKQQRIVKDYMKKLSARVEYNPRGLSVFYKDAELITSDEETIWVCKKDQRKIVYVKSFLPLANRFPKMLDTVMREYAIKRTIEEDLLYEDALTRGLDHRPEFLAKLKARIDDLLYEKFYLEEINQRVEITPQEIEKYYKTHPQEFPNLTLKDASGQIHYKLFTPKREARYQIVVDSLKKAIKVNINTKELEKTISEVIKNKIPKLNDNPQG